MPKFSHAPLTASNAATTAAFADTDGVVDAVGSGDTVIDAVSDSDSDTVAELDSVPDAEAESDGDVVTDGVCDRVAEPESDCDDVGVTLGVAVSERLGVGDAVVLLDGDSETDADGDGDGDGVRLADGATNLDRMPSAAPLRGTPDMVKYTETSASVTSATASPARRPLIWGGEDCEKGRIIGTLCCTVTPGLPIQPVLVLT
jgi:hypothetical protein